MSREYNSNQNNLLPQESFKSTFVNFRPSMKENAEIRKPKI